MATDLLQPHLFKNGNMRSTSVKTYIYDLYDTLKSSIQPLHPRNHTEKTRAFIAVGIVSFFWGTTWLVSKRGQEHMPALQMTGVRHIIAGILYIIFYFFKGFKFPTAKQFIQIFWMSIVMFVISNGFSAWSVKYLPSGLGAVVGAITPIWIAIFSVMFFKEARLNLITIIGLVLGFGGILVIFSDYLQDIFNSSFSIGIVLGVIATMTWALGTIYTARHSKDLNPYYSLGWQMFTSGIILNVYSYASGQYVPMNNIHINSWLAIAYLVVMSSIITFAAFIYALKRLPAAQASVYAYINPIVAIILGALLNNEKLNGYVIIGTLVTLIGVYMVNTGFKKKEISEASSSSPEDV